MKLAVLSLVATSFAGSAVACSSSKAPVGPPTATMTLSMSMTVAPASEVHRCRFVKVDDAYGGYVRAMDHAYTPGSHHLVLFRTNLTSVPAGQEGDIDCFGQGREVMVHARGIVYASQAPSGDVKMPDGVGLPIKSGDILILQAHYLNPAATPLDARVDLRLAIVPTTTPLNEAGVLFFYDPFIAVPAGGRGSAALRCPIANDIHLLSGVSHMHRRGVGFAAFVDAPTGELAPSPFYTSNDWDHPQPLAAPLDVAAGSKVRFRCDYDNGAGSAEVLQGQSAETNEMCVFTGLYYPAMTQNQERCLGGGADVFGAGDKTCSDTFACVQKCPPGSSPKFSGSGIDVDPCWQRCFAASCNDAGGLVSALLGCVRTQCGTDCNDSAEASCAGCVFSKCQDKLNACNAHVCAAGP